MQHFQTQHQFVNILYRVIIYNIHVTNESINKRYNANHSHVQLL